MDDQAKIIFLNGAGSVGKTSIAKALQSLLTEAYLHVGVDQFINMLPEKYINHPEGISFKNYQLEGKPMVEIKLGKTGAQAMSGMRHAIAALADQGNNLIIDEVMIGNEMEDYSTLLSGFQVFYVGVFAPLEIIEEREHNRQDRLIGLARWQYNLVHQDRFYDLEIDTEFLSPHDCAMLIKDKFNL